jgi:membrane-bound serine protease (ClpP class)
MNILFDPNFAYLILVVGLVMGVMALFAPGTGLLEFGAFVAIMLAIYSISNLTINFWALLVLVLGFFPFIVAMRFSKKRIYLVIALVALTLGSAFLINTREGLLAVNPILAGFVSLMAAGLLWFIGVKALEAHKIQPNFNLNRLIGMTGEAQTDISSEGTVHVNGEQWSARSRSFIPVGSEVRIVRREGLILIVEMILPE